MLKYFFQIFPFKIFGFRYLAVECKQKKTKICVSKFFTPNSQSAWPTISLIIYISRLF